ncbi:biotin transporter BioY [Candidatus Chlorohelix sp.]|uniref:biotin transporter BioY n=1 Tax=Candidatus Chlorohelix sp. TaxID=3139201 RepID=UPI00303F599A
MQVPNSKGNELVTARPVTFSDLIPTSRRLVWVREASLIVGFSLLIALAAQVRFYIPPISEVPFVASNMIVVLAAAILGSKRGLAAVGLYLAEGALGLPFFANGNSGFSALTGVTAGYLFGFAVSAFIIGWLAEKGWDKRFTTSFLAMLIGNLIILVMGGFWYSLTFGVELAFTRAILPFLLADAVKMVLAAVVLPSAWFLVKKR